jgi:ketosteroid isomerase-like protein
MSRRPAELLREWYDDPRLNPEAVDLWTARAHPDITWRAIEGAPDDVGVIHGREGFRRYFEELLELFEELEVRGNELIEFGDSDVVAGVRLTGRGRGSGVETGLDFAIHFRFEDELIVRGREYATLEEARAAAGADQTASRS